jgi:asparagine synthase (glutamine-hydrolysing)
MCGIYGYIGLGNEVSNEICLNETMFHRGPNDGGILKKDGFMLGFRRLSILDLTESGHQPMSKSGKKHICFNGEIYNHKELKQYLINPNEKFNGSSDTEILLSLLIEKKENCLSLLNGMFAFTFIDEDSGDFIIARDRLGVKPFYYSIQNNTIFFSSELPNLLEFGIKKEIDLLALNRYIHFGHITPPLTIYKNIFKLEPGHFLKGNLNNPSEFKKVKWWNLPNIVDNKKTESSWLSSIDDLLADAVKIRLVADVPVGLFLSGGIDSSLVAYYSSIQNDFQKPTAFSVIFKEKAYDESEITKVVAKKLGLQLHTINIESPEIKNYKEINSNIGEPFSDSSIVNQYYLSKEARKYATVFLTGDGGDEAFAGYNEYVNIYKNRKILFSTGQFAKYFNKLLTPLIKKDHNLAQQLSKLSLGYPDFAKTTRNNYSDPILGMLINKKFKLSNVEIAAQVTSFWNESENLDIVKRMQYLDYKNYLEPDVLVKVDRSTMLNSIEARSPLLDYRIVELGQQIPTKFNINGDKGKILLRKLAEKHLPKIVTEAPKKGFGLPINEWINDETITSLKLLHVKNGHDYFNEEILEKYIFTKKSSRDLSTIFWRIWMFEEWYKNDFLSNN